MVGLLHREKLSLIHLVKRTRHVGESGVVVGCGELGSRQLGHVLGSFLELLLLSLDYLCGRVLGSLALLLVVRNRSVRALLGGVIIFLLRREIVCRYLGGRGLIFLLVSCEFFASLLNEVVALVLRVLARHVLLEGLLDLRHELLVFCLRLVKLRLKLVCRELAVIL